MVVKRMILMAWAVSTAHLGCSPPAIEEASNLRMTPEGSGVVVEIEAPGGGEPLRYWIDPDRNPPPSRDLTVVPASAERIVALSTTYLGPLAALDALERVVAVDDASLGTNPEFRARVDSGEVAEVGPPDRLDLEAVIAARPDLVLLTRVGPGRRDIETRLAEADIPVLVTSAWKETTPLGRAEWIKLFGLITDRYAEAEEIFAGVAERYRSLAGKVSVVAPSRPKILLSAPYGGTWYLPGGASYSARFISDAGGDYLWKGNKDTGSFPLDFEAVVSRGISADFWLNPGAHRSMRELAAADSRFAVLPAFRNGRVFNRTRETGGNGGNAFWESGAVRPDEVLADLIAILHPEILPDRRLRYYEKLPDRRSPSSNGQ